MLRTVLLWVGALAVVAGAVASFATRSGAGIGLLIVGAVLLVALLIERHRYKRIVDAAPGPEWEPTGERFIEPGSDIAIQVYSHRRSGKRIYVRLDTARQV
jgi:hypothetical protein